MDSPQELSQHFQEALDNYKDGYMAARNLAERTRVDYETDVKQFLRFLQSIKVKDVTAAAPRHIESYMAEMDKKSLAGTSRRRKLVVIRAFFTWLKATDQIAANPAKRVSRPQQEDREPRVLTENEYKRLLAAVEKPRDRAIVQLLLQTGIRLSEIHRLTLSDINLPKRITSKALGTVRILGKRRKTRTVLLNHKACEALATWLEVRPKIEWPNEHADALFLSSRTRPISKRQYQYLVGKYLKNAGIKGAGVHSLRHTFATHHIEMGTELKTAQEFLGHKDLNTTALYIGLVKKRQAIQIQENAL